MSDGTGMRLAGADPYRRTGIVLVVVSFVLFLMLIAVPFLPVSASARVLLATGLLVSSEGTFWLGCVLAGRDVIAYLRGKLWACWKYASGVTRRGKAAAR